MFSGIIETIGKVVSHEMRDGNLWLQVQSPFSHELKVDQSIAHNGVCLTVVEVKQDVHTVVAVEETLQKTTLSSTQKGDLLNLERCMKPDGRFDGHIVQGHVDTVVTCSAVTEESGIRTYDFEIPEQFSKLIVEKGSVCLNGVSLTCYNVSRSCFRVTIIPYTYEHTNFKMLKTGMKVNIEFDIIGKYVQRMMGV